MGNDTEVSDVCTDSMRLRRKSRELHKAAQRLVEEIARVHGESAELKNIRTIKIQPLYSVVVGDSSRC